MYSNNDIYKELQTISTTLANMQKVQPYTVPNGYWQQLTNAIVLATQKQESYTVPNGYFAGLTANIMDKVKATETITVEEDALPEVLQQLQHINVYSTPQGYFEQLTIPTTLVAKVIAMPINRKQSWWKYAAAACIVAMLSVTVINMLTPTTVKAEDKVISGTTLTYKQIQQMNVDAALDTVSATAASNYLCENELVACNTPPEDEAFEKQLDELNISDNELDELLKDVN